MAAQLASVAAAAGAGRRAPPRDARSIRARANRSAHSWASSRGGAIIADGDPHTVIRSAQVAEIYMGIAADA